MGLEPAVTDLDQLKDHPALSLLLPWNARAVTGAKFDRNELSVHIDRASIKEACSVLKPQFNFFSDLTCVDWYPSEPRFEVIYHLLSHRLKERVRLKVRLQGDDAAVESITSVWPAANFFEREVFDLFGVRFLGHPNLRRIMMPEDWEGHPLRKDYPVEGYR
jgi:NADH-quinone oxidoreductase subunit C